MIVNWRQDLEIKLLVPQGVENKDKFPGFAK